MIHYKTKCNVKQQNPIAFSVYKRIGIPSSVHSAILYRAETRLHSNIATATTPCQQSEEDSLLANTVLLLIFIYP